MNPVQNLSIISERYILVTYSHPCLGLKSERYIAFSVWLNLLNISYSCYVPRALLDFITHIGQIFSNLFKLWRWFGFPSASNGFLLGLLFDPEDEKDIFLQNIELSLTYTALKPRILYSSWSRP
jgi:hypothetical protein